MSSFDVSFLFRRPRIKGARMRLFMVYTAGNFIECTTDRRTCKSASTNTASRCSTAPCITTSELYEALIPA